MMMLFHFGAKASHLFGAEFRYVHVSGTTYTVILDVYGDCSGSSFSNLTNSVPQVEIYNGPNLFQTINLTLNGTPTEVTPVCPAQINNTTCVSTSGTIPGVKKFTYTSNINLGSTSANWKFLFTGSFGGNFQAGRSNNITNISIPGGGSVMQLEALLNNVPGPNSNVNNTTIPTPFFCINKPAQYNPGSVDPNNDSLYISLFPGLVAGGTVSYITPYTATSPLSTTAGSYSFNTSTGQLNFTPNIAQKALVVSKSEEYRNGVFVGSCMREMTFVVLNSCNNNSPGGTITNPIGGTTSNGTNFNVCKGVSNLSFSINAADADGDSISIIVAGLPAGSSATIVNNNSLNPQINFSWNITNTAIGNYTFYVTYTDKGCPLASKQTIAYTVNILPKPSFVFTQTQAATCTKKAKYNITASGTSPYNLKVYQGTTLIQNSNGLTNIINDSLSPGTYTLLLTDAYTCFKDTTITISSPSSIQANYVLTPTVCFGGNTGTITANGIVGVLPFQYAINNGNYATSNVFNNLAAGTYTVKVKDANDCVKDTTLTILSPTAISINVVNITNPLCFGQNSGSVSVSAFGGTPNYTYSINGGMFSTSGNFINLGNGNQIVTVKDANNCTKDTTLILTQPSKIQNIITPTLPLCFGNNNGSIFVNGTGGVPNYTYSLNNSGNFVGVGSFNNLASGNYTITTKDANNCTSDTIYFLSQPSAVSGNITLTKPLCNGAFNGLIVASGIGGTSPYTYSINNGVFSGNNNFSGLVAGSYTIKIKDQNGCTKDSVVNLTEPSKVNFTYVANPTICFGSSTGSVVVSANGGTPIYTYAADTNPFQISNTLSNLSSGNHIITVKDSNGCTTDTVVNIEEALPIYFSNLSIQNPTCENFKDGNFSINGIGGTPPYQFSIDGINFSISNGFSNLGEGSITVYIKDAKGCLHDTIIQLNGYPKITFSKLTAKPLSCAGQSDGSISVVGNGGNPPLNYGLSNGMSNASGLFSGLLGIEYLITITDVTGCKIDSSIKIDAPQVLNAQFSIINNPCIGDVAIGSITIDVVGGNQPYSYQWLNAQTTSGPTASNLDNGNYEVAVVDAKGCTDTFSATVNYDNCCTVFVPNAFTPNNDGKNDVVKALYKGDMEIKEFSIYNRFGQRVFTTKKLNEGWDGIFEGELQEIGTYYYYLSVICGYKKDVPQFFKGDITLIR